VRFNGGARAGRRGREKKETAKRPVVAFKIDRDILDRKELSFNVI